MPESNTRPVLNTNNHWLIRWMASFDAMSLIQQAAMLTLPLLLLYSPKEWYVIIPVTVLALAGLIFPNLRKNELLWFALACFLGTGIYFTWEASDNHKYATCYWCLAMFFVLWRGAEEGQLRISARLLVGGIFAFAFLWKVISPDFANGDFFRYTFLFDDRFSEKLSLIGLLDGETMEFNEIARNALTNFEGSLTEVSIRLPEALNPLASFLTWWTFLLEGLIAACFLLPRRFRWTKIGDGLLILFILSTYLVAPVIGFGWLLIVMGLVQCMPERRGTRFSYLMVLLILQLFRLPWTKVFGSFL